MKIVDDDDDLPWVIPVVNNAKAAEIHTQTDITYSYIQCLEAEITLMKNELQLAKQAVVGHQLSLQAFKKKWYQGQLLYRIT